METCHGQFQKSLLDGIGDVVECVGADSDAVPPDHLHLHPGLQVPQH